MYKLFRLCLICWITFVLATGNAYALVVEKLYSLNVKNTNVLKATLSELYKNSQDVNSNSSVYLYDNESRYYFSYLSKASADYVYYYYQSNVNEQKNKELLGVLDALGYDYNEITSPDFINIFKDKGLASSAFGGKLQQVKNGTLGLTYNDDFEVEEYYDADDVLRVDTPAVVTVPAGTIVMVRIDSTIYLCSTKRNRTITATLESDIVQDGVVVAPKGSNVVGSVIPHKYYDYDENYMDLSFTRITTPDGRVIPIRTETRAIYETISSSASRLSTIGTEWEETPSTQRSNSNSGTQNKQEGEKMSTAAKVGIGAAILGVIALGVVAAASSGGDSDSESESSPTVNRTTTTTTTTVKTPEERCEFNNVKVSRNAVIDFALISPIVYQTGY